MKIPCYILRFEVLKQNPYRKTLGLINLINYARNPVLFIPPEASSGLKWSLIK